MDEQTKKKYAIFAMVLGAVVLGYVYQLEHSPRTELLAGAENQVRLDYLEVSNRAARIIYARGNEGIEEQLVLYESHALRLEELIPASEEVAGLLADVNLEAARLNVEVIEFNPDAAEPPSGPYTRMAFSMMVRGEYHDVATYLTSIATLPRIITPVDVELTAYADTGLYAGRMVNPVEARFRIETYVVPAAGSEAPAPDLPSGGE